MNIKKNRISIEKSRLITKLLAISKTATMDSVMSPAELAKIIAIVFDDIGGNCEAKNQFKDGWNIIKPINEYYSIPLEWFSTPIDSIDFYFIESLLDLGKMINEDFIIYLKCFVELHKRRRKYSLILQHQPFPTMIQISPRSLIEYGYGFENKALASWLTWRKFFYDIDNRSAQETGYLFEPILAAAIGGESKSARDRVVRRSDDASKGRQVDCWKICPDGTALAYELKLRVTIAASGQGRFSEELSFANDCKNSNVKPILVVLDPTENTKLTDLQMAYRKAGGEAYIGSEAWSHLEEEAGPTMSMFIKRYVRLPIENVSIFDKEITLLNEDKNKIMKFSAHLKDNELSIKLGIYTKYIPRYENSNLSMREENED